MNYKYSEWKSKAPERERDRIVKEDANIEKMKRIVKMEEQKAELLKQKSKSAKHISEIRKYSQQNKPSASKTNENVMFQPSGFSTESYFTPSKKSGERRKII